MEKYISHIRQPLNLYSIFGYLLPGFFLTSLLVVDYDLSAILRLSRSQESVNLADIQTLDLKINYVLGFFSSGSISDFKFIPFIIFLFFCYFLGHLVSAFSSALFERLIVKKAIGYPASILMQPKDLWKLDWFLSDFRSPFDDVMQKKIDQSVRSVFGEMNKKDYYWLLYSYIINCRPYLAPRVHHFVNLYGFSRNVAATFIIYILFRSIFLTVVAKNPIDWEVFSVLLIYFISFAFMIWNYLKLFKRQAIDIYFLFLSIVNDKHSYHATNKTEE